VASLTHVEILDDPDASSAPTAAAGAAAAKKLHATTAAAKAAAKKAKAAAAHGAAKPGIDFTKLDFGREVFGHILHFKFRTNFTL
jgi:hypothetical protein